MMRSATTGAPLPVAFALLVAAGVGQAAPRDDQALGPALDAVAGRLEAERVARGLPSLSVAVVRGREIVLARAFGMADLQANRPAAVDTIYRAGSLTQAFVATALMQLVERGVVRLDDPITKYLPEYRVRSPWPETPPATLRQLASHTAGLPREAPVNFWRSYSIGAFVRSRGGAPLEAYVSNEALLESLPTVELEHLPSSDPQYSNLGVALLAMALERASGQPFADYVAERILRPLGMSDSGLAPDAAARARMPVGYVPVAPGEPPLVTPESKLGSGSEVYTGGLVATPSDLARFLAAQLPREDGAPSPILSQGSLRQMRAPVGRGGAALGWWTTELDGRPLMGQTGGRLGFLASIAALPDSKLGVAIMTNSWNPSAGTHDTWDLSKMVLSDLAGAVASAPAAPSPFDAAAVDLSRYAGHYALPGGLAHVDVETRGGALHMRVRERLGSDVTCSPTGLDRFSCGLEFHTGKDAAVTGLSYAQFNFRREAAAPRASGRASAPCDTPAFVAPPKPPPPQPKADPFGALGAATCDPPAPTKKE